MKSQARAVCSLIVAAAAVTLLTTATFAVTAFLRGGEWKELSAEYRRGYVAGSVDMMRALADANYLSSSVRAKTNTIIDCIAEKTDLEIVKIFERHLDRHASVQRDSVAPAIYIALQDQCGAK